MELGKPFRLVTSSVDGDVLKVLALAPQREFTPPAVQRIIGERSVAGVRKSLTRLTEQGIVIAARAGNAVLYRFNEQHIGASAITALAHLRGEFLARLSATIDAWAQPCAYSALFGSGARGTMRTDSDLDLFVVRPDEVDIDDDGWRHQVSDLSLSATVWTGNDTRVLELSEAEVRRGSASGDAVLADIAREGVRLTGPTSYFTKVRTRRP